MEKLLFKFKEKVNEALNDLEYKSRDLSENEIIIINGFLYNMDKIVEQIDDCIDECEV